MLMLDLGAGKKGASQAMTTRGWEVITLDINPAFDCDIIADVLNWKWQGERPDLIWFSMPCDEFSRESMPWCKTGNKPDLSLVQACLRIVDEAHPRFWICENTKGAIPWFKPFMGNYRFHAGPFYLWGFFPLPGQVSFKGFKNKENYSGSQAAERAMIPYSLSNAIAIAIEKQVALF